MKSRGITHEKSFSFAVKIVRIQQKLVKEKREYLLSRQLMRSGTSIGANVYEALEGSSKRDFINKMNISLKEAVETEYWLDLLKETGYLNEEDYLTLEKDCLELIKLLTAIIKSSRMNESISKN